MKNRVSIKFFGTSNANPHTDRRQSGILLTIDDNNYLFDCGDGIASALWNDAQVILNKIHAVFFTHRHADHLGGLPALILLMHQRIKNSKTIQPGQGLERFLPPKKQKNSECAIFIPGEQDQAAFFEELLDLMHMANFEIAFKKKIYAFNGNGKIYQDHNLMIESFPTFHVIDASGFKLHIGDLHILISGDISKPKIVAEALGEESWDLVIIENAHFPTSDITRALRKKNIRKLVVTHRRDPIIGNQKQALKDLKPLMEKMEVLLAEDGLELTF